MSALRDPTDATVWHDRGAGPLAWRWHAPGLALALGMVVATFALGFGFDITPRDTDKMLGSRSLLVIVLIFGFLALDVLPVAYRRRGTQGLWATARVVVRERWTRQRVGVVVLGFVSFYATYLSYRNLKSMVPFIVPQDDDLALLNIDRDLFGGHDPGVLLHDVLGTGASAQVLSVVYIFFLAFVPLSLAWVLMTWTNPIPALWYVTALGINWTLGVVSYLVLPSLGPVFTAPALYATLPDTAVSSLQSTLMTERLAVLADPANTANVQSIAAFASLHVSVVLTAALIAQLLKLRRGLRITLWVYLGITTVATLYFGWHYVVDDLAGVLIGVVAVVAGGLATGHLSVPQRVRLWLPNALTGLRVLVIPVVVWLLWRGDGASLAAAALFAAASATDALDGHLARRWRTTSTFGALADPAADKLLVLASLVTLAVTDRVGIWAVVVIALRELWVSGLRASAKRRGVTISASPFGKAKMAVQVATVLTLMAVAPGAGWIDALVFGAVAVTVASGVDYAIRAYRDGLLGRPVGPQPIPSGD